MRSFPTFGFRKIRDFFRHFHGISVSARGVRSTLADAGIETTPLHGPKPRRTQPPQILRWSVRFRTLAQ